MKKLLLAGVLLIEVFAFANQGGGPLLSHLFLTAVTAGAAAILVVRKIRLAVRSWTVAAGLAVFLGLFATSLFTSLTPNYGIPELLLFADTSILFLFFSSLDFEEKQLEWFAKLFVLLTALVSLIGFYFYLTYAMPRLAGSFFRLGEPQHAAFNAFADILLFALPLCAMLYFKEFARRSWTAGWGIIFSILISALILTFSRAAWISLMAGAAVYFAWRIAAKKPLRAVGKRALAAAALAVLIVASLQAIRVGRFETTSVIDKILFRADEGDASAGERKDYWAAAVKLLRQRPLAGSGVGSFRYLYPPLQTKFGIAEDHPHNLFLKIGVENGAPAAAAFLVFIGAALFFGIRFVLKNPESPHKFFLFAAAAALGHNLLDFNFIVSNFMLFFVFAGVLVGSARRMQGRSFSALWTAPVAIFLIALVLYEGYFNIFLKKGRAEIAENPSAAFASLEKAQPLLFDRDRELLLVKALEAAYEQCNEQECAQKLRDARLKMVSTKSIEAARINASGDILRDMRDTEGARAFYQKALELDPANSLEYYYDLYLAGGGPPDLPQKTEKALRGYSAVLARNQHFTVLTENPRYASMLLEFLGKFEEKRKFDELWAAEREKFETKYGTILPR